MTDHGKTGGFRRLVRLPQWRRDLDEELDFHRSQVVEELVARGVSRSDAEQEAGRRFGDEAVYRRLLGRIDRQAERRRRAKAKGRAMRDSVRHAVRSILRTPAVSLGVVLAFGLGIGANAAVFGILERLLLTPPPGIAQPDGVRRVILERTIPEAGGVVRGSTMSYPDIEDLAGLSAVSGVAAIGEPVALVSGRGEAARRVSALSVAGEYWEVLGVRSAAGRLFSADDDRVGSPVVVVVSHAWWKRELGGTSDVAGRTIDLGFGPWEIVGVAPRGFTGVDLRATDVWLPLRAFAAVAGMEEALRTRNWWWVSGVVRLASDASIERAEEQATAAHRIGRAQQVAEGRYTADARLRLWPLIDGRRPGGTAESRVALWLAGVAAVVLLIAAANVANLLLARSVSRQREVDIRLALGASRERLAGETGLQVLLLALVGAGVAILVDGWAGSMLRALVLPQVAWSDLGGSLRVVPLAMGLAVVAAIAAAVVPMRQTARRDLSATLRGTTGRAAGHGFRLRGVLTAAQAGLACLLLIGALLFTRSLGAVRSIDTGWNPKGVWLATLVEEGNGLSNVAREDFFRAAESRIAELPFVQSASRASGVPMYSSSAFGLEVPGLDSVPSLPGGGPYVTAIGLDWFEVMGVDVSRGRRFDERDGAGSPPVAIINETFARLIWPGRDPIGQCFYAGDSPCLTVVGVAENSVRDDLFAESNALYYVPVDQRTIGDASFRLSTQALLFRADGRDVVASVRSELLSMSPELRYASVRRLDTLLDPTTRSWELGAVLFTVFGGLALLVAMLGLYSVLAFDVAQRVPELGVRGVLGATRRDLVRLVVMRGVGVALIGSIGGLVAALLLAPRIEPLLFGVGARDPVTFGVAVTLLLAVALLASAVPALRAASIDPGQALRAD